MVLALFSLGILGVILGVCGIVYAISYYSKDLPDYSQLKDYEPPIVTRVYAGDGRLMAEFATEKRVFMPVEDMPDLVKNAFISAEDQNFWQHQGVDYIAILRAALKNFKTIGQNRHPEGASTITQQVAKNLLLGNEVSYKRKIREAILAYRIERALSKERILELYLNEIYMGQRSYGVTAAALQYFNKPLANLSVAEAAFLGALPKAPNNYNPIKQHDAALARRNWVIDRMQANGFITGSQAELAKTETLQVDAHDDSEDLNAPYFAEEVRREIGARYGGRSLYEGGLVVRTSVDPRLQDIATRALREGLTSFDRRKGWRGPLSHMGGLEEWQERLREIKPPESMLPEWRLAVVLDTAGNKAAIGFTDGSRGEIPFKHMDWAKGKDISKLADVGQVVQRGDVIMAEAVTGKDKEGKDVPAGTYGLMQIPLVNGALIAMDPHTGRVLAMEGGWSFDESEFNRATQAWRQPGSAFKPFIYLSALDKGLTPSTLILDAPIVLDQGPGLPKWRPVNYTREYYGPTPMRVGLEKSRNLMTVRLANFVGMDTVVEYARRFGVSDNMLPYMSNALGSTETTLLRLTTAYAQFVNGGKKVVPTFIDRVQDRRGKTVFSYDGRPCENCGKLVAWNNQAVPEIPDTREQIADPRTAYQIVSMLEGVVQRGTATRLKSLGWPLAGKTGTTNESKDTWFIGFTPDLVVGVFVGYDEPKSLGKRETGASAAVPVFRDFMEEALAGVPPVPFRVPPGIRQMQINAKTGRLSGPDDKDVIWEAFVSGNEPSDKTYVLDGNGVSEAGGSGESSGTDSSATVGTGGLY